MEHKIFRKKNIGSKKTAIFVLLLAGLGYACEKEFLEHAPDVWENSTYQATLDHAKAWYDERKPEELGFRASGEKEKILMKPEWKQAFAKQNEKYKVVECDLTTWGMFSFTMPECMEKYKETKDERYMQSYTRLVLRTDKTTKETVGFLMTIVPDVEYMEKTKFKPFKKICYLDRLKDFGGLILFHNLDGSFSNGWTYRKGKITESIRALESDSVKFELRETYCYREDVFLNVWLCPDWYTGSEEGYSLYCAPVSKTLLYTNYYCYDDGSGNGDPCNNCGSAPTPDPETTTPTVTLTGSNVITLMDSYGLNVTVSPYTFNCTSVVFQINGTYTLQSGTSKSCSEKARKPGYFRIQAIVNGIYKSDVFNVEVQFPNIGIIMGNSTVTSQLSSAWSETKDAASESGRSERGFWVYANSTESSLKLECGSIEPQSNNTDCENESEFHSTTAYDTPSSSPLVGGKYVVAYCHTHTPLTYCPSTKARPVGPTVEDENSFSSIPGLLYDYWGSNLPEWGFVGIRGGHDKNDAAKMYVVSSTTRKATPN